MRDKSKFKKQFQKKSRLEILKSWMTSFVITTAAVVVAVTAIPSSPKAEINQIQIFEDQVIYQIEITDSDNAIQSGSLEIILENQLEHYSSDLTLGVNVGRFSELTDGTTYQMYVMGDKGFGNEKLASRTIVTKPNSGGAILSYDLLDGGNVYQPQYQIDLMVKDNLDEYSTVMLYYGVIGFDEIEPFEYYSFIVSDGESSVVLDQIYQMNAQVYVYLEATLANNETVILDELYFHTPLNFELYYYTEQVTDTLIKLSFYPEFYMFSDLVYEFKLIKDGLTVSVKQFNIDDLEEDSIHDGPLITFDGLKRDTLYRLEVSASYTNPYTLAREKISTEPTEIRTLSAFSYTVDVQEYDTYYDINISVTDPKHNFQLAYYIIYEIQDTYQWYIDGGEFGFTPMDGYKTASFTIDKVGTIPIRIDIGLRNETNSIYYIVINNISILE